MLMFSVIYKDELYKVHDMTDRCYIARDYRGRQVWLPKKDCEVV